MSIDGDNLGTDIWNAIDALSVEDKLDPELLWQSAGNEIADHVNPELITLPVLENWSSVSLLNSWVDYDINTYEAVGFYKDPYSRVYLRGCVKDGTANTIFTLPINYRPPKDVVFTVSENGLFAEITIKANGNVNRTVGGNTKLHLSGISFRI